MFKNFLRIIFLLVITLIIFISYLSIFGIKTGKFNELIISKIVEQDNRINIELEDVYIKLNIKERSFSLNSRNVNLFILKEKQEIDNIDIFIDLVSFLKQENEIKKIIINSKENKILDLIKFIRAYKINIPVLYLENSIKNGNIIYDLEIDFKKNNIDVFEISGKIIDSEINILRKEKFENINFNFNFQNKNLEITNLKLKYKEIEFSSKNISIDIKNNLFNINGDITNSLNLKILSTLTNYNFKKYLDQKTLLSSTSFFEIALTKKLKIKDYKLVSKISNNDIKIKINNSNLKNYLADFEDQILLKEPDVIVNFDPNLLKIKIKSKFILNDKHDPKNISIIYSKKESVENYEFIIDLIENNLNFSELNFKKSEGEKMFLQLNATRNMNNIQIESLKLFNDKNIFNFKNIKFTENFKLLDFVAIDANYYNLAGYLNDISIKKNNNEIEILSNNFDLSFDIEKNLKSERKTNFLNIFKNLNLLIILNIDSAKIDDQHNLNNFSGKVVIKNNQINKANLQGNFKEGYKFIYTKDEIDGKKVTTVFSDIAKPFVKKFKFIKGFEDGKLDYTSTEINKNLSNSELRIYNFKLRDMPVLTKLLSLASLQGIADLATGEGIRFNEFEMFFENSKELITIKEIYALGPAISILMEGYVEKNKLVSLRGTLVPATTINKTIAKIPLLGNILVGEKTGEGVFGVSFKIKGPPKNLDTRVNPIKTLTPRFITRTLDKIKRTK